MKEPRFLYITNGPPWSEEDRWRIVFPDGKVHHLYHMNHHDQRHPYPMICGLDLSKICINIPLPWNQFLYCMSRVRNPNQRELTEEETTSCFPVYMVVGKGVVIGDTHIPWENIYGVDNLLHVQEVYENFWEDTK